MSDNIPDDSPLVTSLSFSRRIMIMIAVVMGTTLYSTTLLVASAILPQMQGSMAATADEIAWTTTFNLLATAIVTPMTGWLTASFGRRRVMLYGVGGFTIATYLCGQAESLGMLVLWRVLQGGIGAPLTPLSNALILDCFPRRQAGLVSSLFGMSAVVLGPVIGPTVGGFLAEAYSWRYAFYMIVPAGMAAWVALFFVMPKDEPGAQVRLDWTGFIGLSLAIGALQMVLSRGQKLDWFESPEIILECFIAALAFYMFVAHSMTANRPFLNPRLLLDRNYALGLILVFTYGMLNFTPLVLLPDLLQTHVGFPDNMIGTIVGFRGIGGTIGFFAAMFIGRLDPRIGLTMGFGLLALPGVWLMNIDLNVTHQELLINSLVQGMATGIVWVPLSVMAFSTLEQRFMAEGMAVFHLLRNLGSSLFISLAFAQVIQSTGANYSRMTEMVSPYNRALDLPWAMGGWTVETVPGLARLAREINRQSALIGYLNAFTLYTVTALGAILIVWLVPKRPRAAV
ncbi:MAG: DHA2 family efflux MFS transporter permease subunit [Acetobacteraceae bacterium]|nr:DHA2 family efflux MFS transporter permease subunit [Acetobacteraceae bacterium]